ncbi:hypothetical protein A5844_000489 [Enterococcus sp. 10A9_DIV0425]|uniref:Uncharacterized protein n=1 Tax=Candidatus Enterococcus wittei TaxID=1987383 RepID=A0A2C9XRB5_9ENTE|nr:hypothetical protein [Enterococcus sp. 10A9_DIV0425]OTP12257.1 hypothetical protein A5844_000489 [Enterococcus sp. 10A9_DIV0425]THE13232.1 hypothetical protein E1H99_06435 [Enterococcus hirae]
MTIIGILNFVGRVLLGVLSMCCFINGTRFLLKVKTVIRLNVGKEMPRTDYLKVETYLKKYKLFVFLGFVFLTISLILVRF